ncbi:hypothetical protein DW211_03930 [Collinsella sp. AM18-10]|nr:hypothetical protein DW211_03930 [Collinsella sp. AM18-10]
MGRNNVAGNNWLGMLLELHERGADVLAQIDVARNIRKVLARMAQEPLTFVSIDTDALNGVRRPIPRHIGMR